MSHISKMIYANKDALRTYGSRISGCYNIKDTTLSTSPYTFVMNITGSDVILVYDNVSISWVLF